MKTGIKVNGPDKEALDEFSARLIDVIHAIADARLDREVSIEVLRTLKGAAGTHISNCYVGDQK